MRKRQATDPAVAAARSARSGLRKEPAISRRWTVLAVAFVTIVFGYAIRNTFSVFYPAIVAEFGWSRGNTALMFSISIMAYGLVAPLAGGLIDRFGPRLALPVGACITGGGLALCSLGTAPWHFYLLYGIVVAAGLSMIGWTPLISILSRWFVKGRGLVFGILGAAFGVSLVSAAAAQFLISNVGWQGAYVIIGVSAVVVIVPLCTFLLKGGRQEESSPHDAVPQASPERQAPDDLKRQTGVQTDRGDDWTLLRALRTHQFWLLFLIGFFAWGVAEQIAIAHQVYFFKDVGYEPMMAATIYSVFGISFVGGTLCGFLSDRLGRERVFIPSCLLGAGAMSLLFFIEDTSQPWMPFLFAVAFGLGLGATGPVFSATVADLFSGKHFGSIQGAITLGFALGGAVSPWLAGFLHDRTGSYFTSFLIALFSLVASAVSMWLIAPSKTKPILSSGGQHRTSQRQRQDGNTEGSRGDIDHHQIPQWKG